MANNAKTHKLVLTALMASLIMAAILFFRIPVPGTQGIVHLGDGMIFLAVLILGAKYAILASSVGSASANIIAGYAFWAPWTFVIKGGMALIMGLFIWAMSGNNARSGPLKQSVIRVVGMALAGIWMVFGYYIAGRVIYGNWAVALLGVPWDVGQSIVWIVTASALSAALCKTPARNYFVWPNRASVPQK